MNERDTYRSQFAAYFAGQLTVEDAARLEAALARDAKLAREAEVLRPLAALIEDNAHSATAEDFRLSADRLAVIRAAVSGRIVEFPRTGRPLPRPLRSSGVPLFRRVLPAIAAAAVAIIGAFAGTYSGRGTLDEKTALWQLATQVSPGSLPSDSSPDDFYSPVYAMDRGVSWPARGAAAAEFARPVPLALGLPGPRPAYLNRGIDFFLL